MTVAERIRICNLAEKIRKDQEFAERINVKDTSHYKEENKNN